MFTRTLFVLTTLLLSVYAFSVTQPNANQGWMSRGTNTLVWERVVTDPSNFTVVLSNLDRSVLPTNNQILVDSVDATSQSSLSIDAPSGGYPVGGTYRVNLVKSPSEVNTIFAQSDEFDIREGVATSSSATETSTSTTSTATVPGTTSTANNPSPSQTNLASSLYSVWSASAGIALLLPALAVHLT